MHKQALGHRIYKNKLLDLGLSATSSTGAVYRVNECFDMGGIGELGNAVPQIEYVPVCVAVRGKFP